MIKELKNIILYGIVGGIATVVEWGLFYLLCERGGVQYLLATAIAFFFSTFANWISGRLILFKKSSEEKKAGTCICLIKELFRIYLTSLTGLLFNFIIMYVLVEQFDVVKMWAKVIATMLVFAYNYLIRTRVIYRNNNLH